MMPIASGKPVETPKHLLGLQLDGLCMHGLVSDSGDFSYIRYEPEYRDVYAVELPKATRMVKTLKRVIDRKHKDQAYEAGDVFMSLANALKLSFAVHRVCKVGTAYDDNNWRFMDLAEGRNCYRDLIEEARAEMRERKMMAQFIVAQLGSDAAEIVAAHAGTEQHLREKLKTKS
jgi:hypothetical protein